MCEPRNYPEQFWYKEKSRRAKLQTVPKSIDFALFMDGERVEVKAYTFSAPFQYEMCFSEWPKSFKTPIA
jgi:hypothetical protein